MDQNFECPEHCRKSRSAHHSQSIEQLGSYGGYEQAASKSSTFPSNEGGSFSMQKQFGVPIQKKSFPMMQPLFLHLPHPSSSHYLLSIHWSSIKLWIDARLGHNPNNFIHMTSLVDTPRISLPFAIVSIGGWLLASGR